MGFHKKSPENLTTRLKWVESEGLKSFCGASIVDLPQGDAFFIPSGVDQMVYSPCDTLMPGRHFALAEIAAATLRAPTAQKKPKGLANDPYFQKIIVVQTPGYRASFKITTTDIKQDSRPSRVKEYWDYLMLWCETELREI